MTGSDRLLVAIGGGVGALARVWLVEAVPASAAASTLAINVGGALLLGVLLGATGPRHRARAVLGTGLLGGFTTFSALSVQVADGGATAGSLLAVASLVLGLAAAAAGLRAGRAVAVGEP